MSKIDNATARMQGDPAEGLLMLAEAMTGGPGAPIERQERDGQRQLVDSDRLPAKILHCTREEFEALGFAFGEPDPDDPMFMPATLPDGWSREGSDHNMWSHIVDPAGRRRVDVFYKAAFYDRSAHMWLASLDGYVTTHVEYDGPLVITDEWATRETVAAALERGRDHQLEEARKFRGYSKEPIRDEANQEHLREIAEERDAAAAKYAARLATLTAAGADV